MWTWLHDGKNKDDRVVCISEVRKLVYAKNEETLQTLYNQMLKHSTTVRYPNFTKYLSVHWDKKFTWAHCYRKKLLLLGNNTNNYAEAGIKELVFSRVKAFNLVQLFIFIYDIMYLYYQKKLIAISNH